MRETINIPQKVNVGLDILGEYIIGLIFISGNLNAVKDSSMIKDEVNQGNNPLCFNCTNLLKQNVLK